MTFKKSIHEYEADVQKVSKAVTEFLEKNPKASAYFFVTLEEHDATVPSGKAGQYSLDGGGFSDPFHVGMAVQALGTTIVEIGNDWKIPTLRITGQTLLQVIKSLFGGNIEESQEVDATEKH